MIKVGMKVVMMNTTQYWNKGDVGKLTRVDYDWDYDSYFINIPSKGNFIVLEHEFQELIEPNKSNTKEPKTQVKVDMLFDKPTVEEDNKDVYIFSGRTTIYLNIELGVWGMARCNSNELNTYSKEIGKAVAYYHAYNK
jgi:hypothetical protein